MTTGKILRNTRKRVEDDRTAQNSYSDDWLEQVSFEFDGPVTEAVEKRIRDAIYKSNLLNPGESSYGMLRWRRPDSVHSIDAENKRVLIRCSVGIAD